MTEELTKSQINEIKEQFANDARIEVIARNLRLDPRVVRDALADPRVAAEALVKKQELYAVELVGVAFDRLSEVIRHGEPQHMLSAVRLLHQLTSTDWLPQQKGQEKKEEVIEIAGLLEELDGGEPETED
jgi:hypothetical protein